MADEIKSYPVSEDLYTEECLRFFDNLFWTFQLILVHLVYEQDFPAYVTEL